MKDKYSEAVAENGRLGGIAKGLAYQYKRNNVRADYLNGFYDMQKLAAKYNLSVSTVYKYVQHFRHYNAYGADLILQEIIEQNKILEHRMEQFKLMSRAASKINGAL